MLDKLRNKADFLLSEESDKYTLIKNILSDDECFFKLSIEEAYAILRDLKINEEDINKVYISLISKENYEKIQ